MKVTVGQFLHKPDTGQNTKNIQAVPNLPSALTWYKSLGVKATTDALSYLILKERKITVFLVGFV